MKLREMLEHLDGMDGFHLAIIITIIFIGMALTSSGLTKYR